MSRSSGSHFSFLGGNLALDFANTVAWRLSDHPEERLRSIDDLLSWCVEAALMTRTKAAELRRRHRATRGQGGGVLANALASRELIYRLFEAIVRRKRPQDGDLRQINGIAAAAARSRSIEWSGKTYEWRRAGRGDVEAALDRIMAAALELLVSDVAEKVSQCQDNRGCGWLFLDRSRSKKRRWCSMADCGNRAKARDHYQRLRKTIAAR